MIDQDQLLNSLTLEWQTANQVAVLINQPYPRTKMVLDKMVAERQIDFQQRGNRKYYRRLNQ